MDFKELFNALKDEVKDTLKDAAPKGGTAPTEAASSPDVTREMVIAAYKKYLDARDLSYTYNSTTGTLTMDFTLTNRLKSTKVVVQLPTEHPYCQIRAFVEQPLPQQCRRRLVEFIADRNMNFVFGRFLTDGEKLVYDYVAEYGGLKEISDDFIARSVMIPLESLKVTGDELADIIGVDGEGASVDAGAPTAGDAKGESGFLTPLDVMTQFCRVMDGLGYKYDTDADKKSLNALFQLNGRVEHARLLVNFNPNGYMIRFEPVTATPEENRDKMVLALNRWNYHVFDSGNCEMCPDDGRIFYKFFVHYEKLTTLPKQVILSSLHCALDSFDSPPKEVTDLLLGPEPNEEKPVPGKLIEFPRTRRDADKDE